MAPKSPELHAMESGQGNARKLAEDERLLKVHPKHFRNLLHIPRPTSICPTYPTRQCGGIKGLPKSYGKTQLETERKREKEREKKL